MVIVVSTSVILAEMPESEYKVGGTIYFGQYEQDNNTENGLEPIEWVILELDDEKALITSKYALDCQAFESETENASWEKSNIRTWLNDTFIQTAFTEEEQLALVPTLIKNGQDEQNPEWNPIQLEDTKDRVFLLSFNESRKYFPEDNDRKLTGTEYARANGAKFLGITAIGISETDWWLRSPGKVLGEASMIGVRGEIITKNKKDKLGIRPVLYLDLSMDRSFFPYEQYLSAMELQKAEKYEEAAIIFESLGDYNGSVDKNKFCKYSQAAAVMESGDYNTALRIFESLEGYEDSYQQGRECRYQMALEAENNGEYKEALKLFEKAGQYKDSMDRLKKCTEKLGMPIYYFTTDTLDVGLDTGFSQNKVIDGNNVHFGWRLGRFFMSDFTRVIPGADDNPIFIKTLGDSVTLWFELEQDIATLNNNSYLRIREDGNGYDQYFGVPKTNFGIGALIARHKNYQNMQGEPQLYTDYLLAKGTSGADTKIVLKEEGDYEVALNYEIEDSNIVNILNKHGNYRIFIKFSVRNGNCMVYPFDVLTGAELQNTSVTENGFSLDLARSRYLDIDVKRSVLIEGPSGIIEDERFNRPARDGDQYIDEGIYTISVSNRYTGESTTKTIFVGSDELLQQYISDGFSVDRLK